MPRHVFNFIQIFRNDIDRGRESQTTWEWVVGAGMWNGLTYWPFSSEVLNCRVFEELRRFSSLPHTVAARSFPTICIQQMNSMQPLFYFNNHSFEWLPPAHSGRLYFSSSPVTYVCAIKPLRLSRAGQVDESRLYASVTELIRQCVWPSMVTDNFSLIHGLETTPTRSISGRCDGKCVTRCSCSLSWLRPRAIQCFGAVLRSVFLLQKWGIFRVRKFRPDNRRYLD